MNQWQNIFPGSNAKVKAKIVGHTLVATFRVSNPPTIWRMDLDKNHSFAVAIQKHAADWELGIMAPKGEFTTVARFDDRLAVDEALAAVETAMFGNPNSTGAKTLRIGAMTATVLAILLAAWWTVVNLSYMAQQNAMAMQQQAAVSGAGRAAPAVALKPGTPADADTVLGRQ
ncbi:MAG: hypothetical protein WDO70_00580 [Alphaproteobacteria bacterium]